MASGIYSITAPSGKRYIGSAANIAYRWKMHRSALRNKRHQNSALQHACDKYGLDALRFEVLEHCGVAELFVREQRHIDAHEWGRLYNLSPTAGGGSGPHTLETRAKMSATAKAQLSDPAFREARRLATLSAWAAPERGAKIAAKLRGHTKSEAHKQRLSEYRMGRKDPAEARERKSAAREGWRAQEPYAGSTSGYVGVSFHKATNKWTATVRVAGRNKHLGCFISATLANEYRLQWIATQEAN